MHRDKSIDIAKAIGILLMIVGHLNQLPLWFEKWIFSFHMPLFFFLSGYLYKFKSLRDVVKGGFKSLVYPYLATTLFGALIVFLLNSSEKALDPIIGSFWGCQGNPNARFVLSKLQSGPIWFLMSLFWSRIYLTLIIKVFKRSYVLICFVIGMVAIIVSSKIINVPLCIMSGASALVFYASGKKMKDIGFASIKAIYYIPIVLVWLFLSQCGYLNMALYMYHPYYLSIVGGILGSIVIFKISSFFSGRLANVLAFIGSSTLEILCSHTFAYMTRKQIIFAFGMNVEDSTVLNISLVLLTLLYTVVLLLMKKMINRKKICGI